ncbi:AGAP005141-PA-like protein [Anopheles sinensis]|uniref:AGAP005141-PA-like protein n=1 Tax=Anopheles sinensis TaxID=74873 RepID=A0A084VAU7_ANOSI|nr:AGAP005141-PA-like protein [Anopheles sinensis]
MDINRNNAFFDKLKQNVTDTFDRLRKAVDMREKLLLRQLSVVVQQSQHTTFEFDRIRFLGDGEDELIARIRTYGRYNIDNFNVILQKEPYENEDYILPSNDHDLMHKSCRQGADDERDPESEEIVVEFFNNRSLIKDSAEMLRESIINLTLNESREIIDRSIGAKTEGPTGHVEAVDMAKEETGVLESMRSCKIDPTTHRLLLRGRSSVSDVPFDSLSFQGEKQTALVTRDDGCNNNNNPDGNQLRNTRVIESRDDGEKQISLSIAPHRMIPKASQTDGLITVRAIDSDGNVRGMAGMDKSVKNVGHLTMNSCGSTINLKNVTNLTINACSERAASTPGKTDRARPEKEAACGTGGGKSCPSEEGSPECGFYKRLITENKILRNHVLKSMLSSGDSNHPKPMVRSSDSDHSGSTTSKNTTITDGPSSTITSVPEHVGADMDEKDPYLKISLSDKELQHMLDMPSSLHDKSLSFVLGELYGLAANNSANGPGVGSANTPGSDTKEHSNQIQQWLKQIISESETEPFQNAEMLEFSKIHN